jgi:hypothetical protein
MVSRFEHGEGTDNEYPIKKPIPKSIFYLDENELENMNKEGWKVNKHVELWVKNAFDQWKVLHGFNTKKSIIDLSKDESYV